MALMLHCPATFAGKLASGTSASDLLRSSSNGICGVPLKDLGRARFGTSKRDLTKRDLTISARIRKGRKREYPWPKDPDPNVKGGILRHLSPFKPLKEKPKEVTLEFEKPLKKIRKTMFDIQKLANKTGMDFSEHIMACEFHYQQALRTIYKNLTPIQRVQIARHPNRPTFLDHVFNITEKFVELHGDRAGYDDPAIVTGLGTINGKTYMFMGHQKGRNTKENIKRNFGMPTPHGYRKALRMMYYADHHGFPIVTFIDTPGAFADLKCEELGQGEAIANNLRTMFGLKVPVISFVIGEGGSGGALAIGCANKLIMLENAVFYVASPEACAAILWKSAKMAYRAAKKLRITAKELNKLKICDVIVPEPLGGAHTDPEWTSEQIKSTIVETMEELEKMDIPELLQHRMAKFRKIGDYKHFQPQGPKITYDSTNRSNPVIAKPAKKYKLELPIAKALTKFVPGLATKVQLLAYLMMVKELENAILLESSKAAKITGFNDKITKLREEYSKDGVITPALQEKLNDLTSEFWQMLSSSPNFESLESKLNWLRKLVEDKRIRKTDGFMFEVTKKVAEVLLRPDMKKKRDEVESLMNELGVSNLESDDLDPTLKDKIDRLDLQLATETNYLIPYHLLIELLKESPEFKAAKETGSVLKEYVEKYKEIISPSAVIEKLKKVLPKKEMIASKDEPNKNLKAHVRKQIKKEISNINYSLGLRELLKKVKGDRDVDELMEELTEKFEGVLTRPDVEKKREFVKHFNKLGSAKSKKIVPVVGKKAVKAKKDIVSEVVGVLKSLGLDELLDEKFEVESILKDENDFKNGSVIKEKVAVGTDRVEIIAKANSRDA